MSAPGLQEERSFLPKLCCSSFMWRSQKSVEVCRGCRCSSCRNLECFHVEVRVFVSVTRLTSMSVSFCDWVMMSKKKKKKTIRRQKCMFLFLPSWVIPLIFIISGPLVLCSQRRKQKYLLWKTRLAPFQSRFNCWFADGNEAICFHYFHFVVTARVRADNRVFVCNKWSKFRRTAFHHAQQSQGEN